MFGTVNQQKLEAQTDLMKLALEFELNDKICDRIDTDTEDQTVHKLKIIIRDLQDKVPKIQEEVATFVDSQAQWREEKEAEFQKSIGTIKSQMAPTSEETGENEMSTKYKDLCDYVETMKGEVANFKEA